MRPSEYPKAPGSILPDILAVAQEHGIHLGNRVSHRPDEVRAHCPFCDDRKYHLYLNPDKQTFNCYRCGTKGGVIRFLSLLTGDSETNILEEIKAALKNSNRTRTKREKIHPALRLNSFQLRHIGRERPDWNTAFKVNPQRAKKMADEIWQTWQAFLEKELYFALSDMYMAIQRGQYSKEVEKIKARSKEIGYDLLTPCLMHYASPNPPRWVKEAKNRAEKWIALELDPTNQPISSLIRRATRLVEIGLEEEESLPVATHIIQRWSQKLGIDLWQAVAQNIVTNDT